MVFHNTTHRKTWLFMIPLICLRRLETFKMLEGAPRPTRRPPQVIAQTHPFRHINFGPVFFSMYNGFRLPFWVHLWCFVMFFGSFVRVLGLHGILIVFPSIVGWFCHRFSLFLQTDLAPVPSLANLVFEQHYGVLRSKSSFDPFRKTLLLMSFQIFFGINCCIDFWLVSVSILAPCWEPFGILFHVFSWLVFQWFVLCFLLNCDQKWFQKVEDFGKPFPYYCNPILHVVFLKVPWLMLARFLLEFNDTWQPVGSIRG